MHNSAQGCPLRSLLQQNQQRSWLEADLRSPSILWSTPPPIPVIPKLNCIQILWEHVKVYTHTHTHPAFLDPPPEESDLVNLGLGLGVCVLNTISRQFWQMSLLQDLTHEKLSSIESSCTAHGKVHDHCFLKLMGRVWNCF